MQITQNQNAIRIWKNLELNIIYAGHAIVGQDWKEPKVCSPFSRIYYIVDGEGILTVNGQRYCPEKRERLAGLRQALTFGYFCESSMEQLFFHLNVLCSDGTDLLYGVRRLYEQKRTDRGSMRGSRDCIRVETMTGIANPAAGNALGNPCGIFGAGKVGWGGVKRALPLNRTDV